MLFGEHHIGYLPGFQYLCNESSRRCDNRRPYNDMIIIGYLHVYHTRVQRFLVNFSTEEKKSPVRPPVPDNSDKPLPVT